MDLDTARSQQQQVATAIHLLAMLGLCIAIIVAMNAASYRARVQDENFAVMAIAARYLEEAEREDAFDPEPIRMGALKLVADREQGVALETRSIAALRTFDFEHFDLAGDQARELNCLSEAIYYEARSERMEGQLAVAQVVINRSESRQFPSSYCGVVYQRAQFSFVRGGKMPRIKQSSAAWKRAKAVARIAHQGLWDSEADDSLYFHANYVRPSWAKRKVARATIKTHIFYR